MKIENIDLRVVKLANDLDNFLKKEGDYNFLYGYQSGYEMSKHFVNIYENEGIDKIKQILDFQISGLKRMRGENE